MDRRSLAGIALFIVNLLYGINYVVAKGLMPAVIGPSGFILLRVLGATVLFWAVWCFMPQRVARGDVPRIVLCAVSGVAVNQLMFFHGLMRTSPGHASIIMVATPILVLVLSSMVLHERITATKAGGVALGAAGASVLILLRSHGAVGSSVPGDLFILMNASSYAVFLVAVKPLMVKYHAVTVMAWCFLIGSALVAPFGLAELGAVQWAMLTPAGIAGLMFVVVMVTFVAYLLNTWALRYVHPGVAGTFIYLQPVLALLATWMMADVVDLGPPQVLAALCICSGVYLVGRSDRVKGEG